LMDSCPFQTLNLMRLSSFLVEICNNYSSNPPALTKAGRRRN
jgi:hypothetical protein